MKGSSVFNDVLAALSPRPVRRWARLRRLRQHREYEANVKIVVAIARRIVSEELRARGLLDRDGVQSTKRAAVGPELEATRNTLKRVLEMVRDYAADRVADREVVEAMLKELERKR